MIVAVSIIAKKENSKFPGKKNVIIAGMGWFPKALSTIIFKGIGAKSAMGTAKSCSRKIPIIFSQ